MEGNFNVTTIVSDWEPPFEKTKEVVTYTAQVGEAFDESLDASDIFKVVDLKDNYAVISHNPKYTLKEGQYRTSDLIMGSYTLKVPLRTEIKFSYMWGSKGVTKILIFEGY